MRAIGIIETRGLAAALEAADSAVKAADVKLLGYELSRGAGQVTVKLEGDVSAIGAGVAAGAAAAAAVNVVIATLVIGRPHEELTPLIYSAEVVGLREADAQPSYDPAPATRSEETPPSPAPERAAAATCNLCHDPLCPRVKGEPHSGCIHAPEHL